MRLCIKAAVLICVLAAFVIAVKQKYKFHEVDSYSLPIISIQYRGALECCQEDILQARIDFPQLYENVESYDQLREMKLVKITEDCWLPYYFPIYAMLCLPVKLILQLFGWNQELCFTLTNALLLSVSLCLLGKYVYETKDPVLYLFLAVSPIWLYLSYIGMESVLFSMIIVALIAWRKGRYYISALLISILSMANPTVMGIGIFLFVDYIWNLLTDNNPSGFTRQKMLQIIGMMACYLPSLIPFIYTYRKTGKWSLTAFGAVMSTWDTLADRVLAYLFDLNLGVAAISVVVAGLFAVGLFYSLFYKERHLFLEYAAALFTVICFSLNVHINCGMLFCARYVIWVYPAVVFPVSAFLCRRLDRNWRVVLTSLSLAFSVFAISTNMTRSCQEFSSMSQAMLNYIPQYYISCCKSTFASRTDHYDAALDPVDFVVYSDPGTKEIRKILYKNTDRNKDCLVRIIRSVNTGNDARNCFPAESDEQYHYVSFPAYAQAQYTESVSAAYVKWVSDCFELVYDRVPGADELMTAAEKINRYDDKLCGSICESLSQENAKDPDFIHALYKTVLGRSEVKQENAYWCEQLQNGAQRSEVFLAFLRSEEFRSRNRLG